MAIGVTKLFETRNYVVHAYRHGAGIVDRLTGKEVYFQPGDDTLTFLTALEAIEEEHPPEKWDVLRDIVCSEYF
ncbi:hypothetical protein EVB84_005 [Rhizobium phage RHph_Y48]|nr:hypothetical protein EVB84_005 [Rhizobium phage RHph_Y48]QIG70001.1 hypothetical protein EVB85_005 [Rhizobium phage RHph_Y86]QIG70053.1 hypothetical protein EVB86_005 [Rhizobium phage RHph_Y2_7]